MASLKDEIKDIRSLITGKKIYERTFQTVHTKVEERIFSRGKDSKETQIGRYSKSYLKTRKRKHYPQSLKVILQATNQMINDFRFGIDNDGKYASGFVNSFNFKKSYWVEQTYKSDIFSLSPGEETFLQKTLDKLLRKYLDG